MNWKRIVFGAAILILAAGLFWRLPAVSVDLGVPSDASISSSALIDSSVTTTKIRTNNVTTAKIAADAVTDNKLDAWVAAMSTEGRAPAGTLYTVWHATAGGDTGYYMVNVDEDGDTLALYISRKLAPAAENVGLCGPYAYTGAPAADSVQFWCVHDWNIWAPRSIVTKNFHLDGTARYLFDYDTTVVIQTSEMIMWDDSWEFQCWHVASKDTIHLLVKRSIATRRGEPYFLVRYMFASDDSLLEGDTLRVSWSDEPFIGSQSPWMDIGAGSFYDVGYVPGYGEIRRRILFADSTLDMCAGGYVFGFADIGNAHAKTGIDTINGASAYLNSELKADCGSGTEEFIASFIAWNTSRGIYPTEIAYVDSAISTTGFPNLAFDSTFALHAPWDTTDVLSDNDTRILMCRTPAINMALGGNYQSMEFAIGRARIINDRMPPIFPRVMFLDGTVLEPMNLPRKE